MNGIHVNSTAPFFARHPDSEYSVEDFGLYCEVISALQWRKMNGDIFMVADSRAAEYYRKIGIDKVWNGITELIPDELDGIDPEMFWAAGKLFALRDIPENAALVDEDLIVWKTLNFRITQLPALTVNIFPRAYTPTRRFSASAAADFLTGSTRPLCPATLRSCTYPTAHSDYFTPTSR